MFNMNSTKSAKVILKKKQDSLSVFMDQFRINEGDDLKITHTSWGKLMGKFHIPDSRIKEFHKLYAIEVQNKASLGIIEQHKEVGPVVIDFDFKFDLDVTERRFDEDDIKKIVKVYMDEIKKSFIIDDEINKLMAFVFLREKPYQFKGNTKDGIHIIFPFIISVPEIQLVIRNNVMKKFADEKILDHIGMKNQISDIIDRSVIDRNGWFMFGSTKPYCTPYMPTYIFDGAMQRIRTQDAYYDGMTDIPYFFSIRRYTEEDCLDINSDKMDDLDRISKKKITMTMKRMKKYTNSHYDTKQLSKLLSIMSNRRAEDYELWLDIGFCLYNINHNDIDLLNLWIEFSKRSNKFVDGGCEKRWSDMKGSNSNGEKLGIGSIYYWAKTDNPEEYMKIKREDIRYYIDKSLNCTNYDIAKVLHEMFKYQFVCASIKYNTWYEFKDHRWQEDDHAICLRKRISTELVKEYMQIVSDYNEEYVKLEMDNEISNEEKEKAKQEFEDKTKVLTNIMLKLKTTSFKDNVMRECKELFYEKKFIEKLDDNPYLIGFENGVYDLKRSKFRDGEPEDYVSMTTGIYYQDTEENATEAYEAMEFVKQIIPNFNVRHYVLKLLASTLQGYNAEEKFRIWTGCHAKGTSIMLADGTSKNVEDITTNDKLMGDDSTPRNIYELKRGHSDMYKIIPSKGDPFVVNGDHIMCLKATKIGSVCINEKENRVNVLWQERDEFGYPIEKEKNFPFKHEGKKDKEEAYQEAYQEAIKFNEENQKTDKYIKQGDVIEIPVREYLKRLSKIGKHNYFGYRVEVNYEEKKVNLDPYLLGYWIGNGHSAESIITTIDKEVVEYYQEKVNEMGLLMRKSNCKSNKDSKASTYHIRGGENKNSFLRALQDYNLINNKHIPYEYKCNSRDIRLKVLAGIIDSYGNYQKHTKQYELIMKSEKIIDDVIYLCRSLGFACYKKKCKKTCTNGKNGQVEGTYFRIQIFGNKLGEVPVLIKRKMAEQRTINKNPLLYGIKIEQVDDDDYYGFSIDKNQRYLLTDFSCTHNTGGNGKSVLLELFSHAFGDYYGTFPVTLFTGKRAQSNAATPEVAGSKGKRLMQVDEPEEGANINVGLMKNYTGGDKITARGLFKEPVEFKPQFKIVLLCNDLPTVPPYDGGVWRRLEVVEFVSKFVDNPQEEGEFKKDDNLKYKLVDWKEAFMGILLEYYEIYKKEGLIPPDEVTKFTKEFQKNCDAYSDFITDRLVQIDDLNVGMKPSEIYREFKVWHAEVGTGIKSLRQKELVSYFEKKYGKKIATSEFIKGFKLKKDQPQFSDYNDQNNNETIQEENSNEVHIDVSTF